MQPVLWSKGVLLSPQHLQAQDRFLEDVLRFQLSTLVFCPWGFRELRIDPEALAGGTLALTRASGLFPDGLAFDMPGADPLPPPKPLAGLFGPDQQSLDVHLAIPEYRPDAANVSSGASQRDRDTRYRAEDLLRRDETTGLAERPIQVGRKNVRLAVEGESLDGSSVLSLARLTRAANGDVQLDARFVPPLVDFRASEHLMTVARRLVEILSARITELSGMRRQRSLSLADFGVADVGSFWLLYTLNTALPTFRHLYETRRGHPAELFDSMLTLAGTLMTFAAGTHPRELPAYEHEDLAACFTALDTRVRELLEAVVPAAAVSLPLKLVQPSIYATALDEDRYLAAPQLYLALSIEGRPLDPQRATQLIKVSAAGQVDFLVRQALAGLPLTHTPNPPAAVPMKVNYQYFLIRKSGPEWDAVARSRNLAAYIPAELGSPQLELVVVLR